VNKEDHYNEGMELFAQDKLEEAVAAYLRALEEDPNHADALHALAMTYAHQEKFDQAIEVGKRLIEVAPDDELAYTSLSIFYQKQGLIAEAEQIAADAGIGFLILQSGNLMETTKLMVGIVVLSLLGVLSHWGLSGLERAVIRWRHT